MSSELLPLLPAAATTTTALPRPSIARWWILWVTAYSCFVGIFVFNAYSPISTTVEALLGWQDSTIALLANWSPIASTVSFPPLGWLMTKSPRWAMYITAALIFVGTGIRVLSLKQDLATLYLANLGQILNGLAMTVTTSIGPLVSALWFPVEQRTVATAIMTMSGTLGQALSCILGPVMVPSLPTPLSAHDQTVTRKNLEKYLLVQFASAAVLLVSVLVYFPNQPKHAPTITAGLKRDSFWKGLKVLLFHRDFWLLMICFSLVTGVTNAWWTYFLPNFKHFRPADKVELEAGWLAGAGAVGGLVGSLIVSKLADMMRGYYKFFLLSLCTICGVFVLWFTLLCIRAVPGYIDNIYVFWFLGISIGLTSGAPIPIFYEAAAEATYPVDESTTTVVLNTSNNFPFLVFLFLPQIPHIGYLWPNWVFLGTLVFSCFVLAPFRERYLRLKIDALATESGAAPSSKALLVGIN